MAVRATNTLLLVLLVVLFATGIGGLLPPDSAWPVAFYGHRLAALGLLAMLVWKAPIVWRSWRRGGLGARGRWISLVLLVWVSVTVALGLLWTLSGEPVPTPLGFSAVSLHSYVAALVVPFLLWHAAERWAAPKGRDFAGRRRALKLLATGSAAALTWAFLEVGRRRLSARRYTGSWEVGSFTGNRFPTTAFITERPGPVDPASWRLRIGGSVDDPLELTYADLLTYEAEQVATLDCTNGWYSTQRWRGVWLADILDRAGARGTFVQFKAVTGYQWLFTIEEARTCLLATHVGDEPLSHGHGFPLRLVAADRRGFQWVKWLESITIT